MLYLYTVHAEFNTSYHIRPFKSKSKFIIDILRLNKIGFYHQVLQKKK